MKHSPGVLKVAPQDMPLPVAQFEGPAQVPVSISQEARYLLTTDDQFAGLYLTDLSTNETVTITRSYNSGYYARISPDNQFVSFKAFRPDGELFDQAAMVYEISTNTMHNLTGWVPVAGTPAVAPSGRIAYTSGKTLHLTTHDFRPIGSWDIGHASNLLDFSPDETQIAFTDSNEQIAVLNTLDGRVTVLTDGMNAYWAPRYSQDGTHIAYRTINGKAGVVEVATRRQWLLGDGEATDWISSKETIFMADGGGVRIATIGDEPKVSKKEAGTIGVRWWAVNGPLLASQRGENLEWGRVEEGKYVPAGKIVWKKPEDGAPKQHTTWPILDDGHLHQRSLVTNGQSVEITGVPYIHQVYDIPDSYDGHWACNAVCAIMTLGYHRALPPQPVTVSRPATHTSNFGHYIVSPYTIGDYQFTASAGDAKGKETCGGYGYIVRDNWKDTKNYMADYFRLHGLQSAVDWNPTVAKARGEISSRQPFVLLNSITLAGHYITAIGYVKDRNTLIFHDPYGNKNTREYPSLDGRRAYYDLPGYNNGYQNLRIVHCYIYARPGQGVLGAGVR